MTTSTLNILTSKVISMGNLILIAEKVSDISTTISGMSESTSNMKAVYNSTTYGHCRRKWTIQLRYLRQNTSWNKNRNKCQSQYAD